jgi:GDP-L-fucose synthase
MAEPAFPIAGKTVWVAGHRGMVGQALVRRLSREACRIVTVERAEADLRDAAAVARFLDQAQPDAVLVAAARVGGILAEFLYDNLAIETAIIHGAHLARVRKLLFLGSSCIYPRDAAQPMTEAALLTGPLEPTNQWYAIAKIAGIKLCDAYRRQYGSDFISAMPTNLYGPGDNYDLAASHVVPALMRKMHEAKLAGAASVPIWGSGRPRREFLHVDDLADACLHLLQHYSAEGHVNVGTGEDVTITEVAETIREVTGFAGDFVYDVTKPDGTPRKLLDVGRLHGLGWRHRIGLRDGLADAYRWFVEHPDHRR